MPDQDSIPTHPYQVGQRIADMVLHPVDAISPSSPAPVAPSQALRVHVVANNPRSITLAWNVPTIGTRPFAYTVFYRLHGAAFWSVGAVTKVPTAVVRGLKPSSEYEFEIMTHNL